MICVAISDTNIEKCISVLDEVQMAEIRLDLNDFTEGDIRQIFSHNTPTIATCRPDVKGTDYQLWQLEAAIKAGAKYVDIEIETKQAQLNSIIALAQENSCKVIVSYHNFDNTPGLKELYNIMDQCFNRGADIAKIVTQSNSQNDNARLLSLYSDERPLVALGMGDLGKLTRIVAPLLGAEFTFAAMDEGKATAPGQIRYSDMIAILNNLHKEIKI